MGSPKPKRLEIDERWLGMPLVAGGGFDSLQRPLSLLDHAHAGYEITYIERGEVTWQLATGESLNVSGGKMAITQPGLHHAGEWEIIRPCTLYWIIYCPAAPESHLHMPFSKDLLAQIDNALASAGNRMADASSEIAQFFKSLHGCLSQQEGREPVCRAKMRSLAALILMEAAKIFVDSRSLDTAENPKRISRLLDDFLHDRIPVSVLAQRAGMSLKSFRALLKKETGQSPADYLARARCARARDLLAQTDQTITEIAFNCGFESSQYFATCFRKYTGMTPGAFRKSGKAS